MASNPIPNKAFEDYAKRVDARIAALELAGITGQYCRVTSTSPLTVELPGNPAAVEAQQIPGVIYTTAATPAANAVAVFLGPGGQPFIIPLG